MTTARRPRWTSLLVAGGLLLALSGPAYYLYATSQPVIGANIGAGFAMMWTALWGLPWSIWPWMSLDRPVGNDSEELAFFACALVNVALLCLVTWRGRRRASDTATTTSSALRRQA
jgi:hypothetical protein